MGRHTDFFKEHRHGGHILQGEVETDRAAEHAHSVGMSHKTSRAGLARELENPPMEKATSDVMNGSPTIPPQHTV